MNFGSIIEKVSNWAENFRARYASLEAVYTSNYVQREIHVSPYSFGDSEVMVDIFDRHADSAVWICFVREFVFDGVFDPPKRGDTIEVGEESYRVELSGTVPVWIYNPTDTGRGTILVNTRKNRG